MIFGGAIDVGSIFGWGVAWCGALPGENEYERGESQHTSVVEKEHHKIFHK